MAAAKPATKAGVVKVLERLLAEADERKYQKGDRAALYRTIRIVKGS